MNAKTVLAARLLLGVIYTINGLNWWFKMITPYPSMSDFATMAPPPDVVGALISNGMFHMVKAVELLAGIALLCNVAVPLMLVAVVPVTLSVCIVDVVFVATLRGYTMGGGAMLLNTFLIMAYFGHYRTLFTLRGVPLSEDVAAIDARASLADGLGALIRAIRPAVGILSVAVGLFMLGWLVMMIGQYIADPLPLSAVIHHKP